MDDCIYNVYLLEDEVMISNHKRDPWRNGGASDSRSKGCVFDSRRVHFRKVDHKDGLIGQPPWRWVP